MREVVTAKGKVLNMAALASANEKEIAVGNMDVNARGDVLKSGRRGEIVIQNEEVKWAQTLSPLPRLPHLVRKTPLLSNFWMRWLLVSAT